MADYDGSYIYGCGPTIDQSKANYSDNGFANPLGLIWHPFTSPVNHYSPYGYGMNDMAGNVLEWTSSIYPGSYPIIRGGTWLYVSSYCAVSFRSALPPNRTSGGLGFRVCR